MCPSLRNWWRKAIPRFKAWTATFHGCSLRFRDAAAPAFHGLENSDLCAHIAAGSEGESLLQPRLRLP
jgi:hypothetical protein